MKKINLENVYIWGTGANAKKINEMYSYELARLDLIGYIDNDKDKCGKMFYGKKVFSPDILLSPGKKNIFIPNKHSEEIRQQIKTEYREADVNIINEDLISRLHLIVRYENSSEGEISEIVDYLIDHPLSYFNYPFTEKYTDELSIHFDTEKGLFYTIFCEKKMYFSRTYDTEEKVKAYYKSILLEQDKSSPHLYITEFFDVNAGSVVVDAGAAEGNFSLAIIDKVKKIYMFEPDNNWYEALNYTFEPYKEKVCIINKVLSNYENDITTTIDISVQEPVNFIKMDVEGEELYALIGALKTINKSSELKCSICTYHQEFAYQVIKSFFDDLNMSIETSRGYMWYPDLRLRVPVLRRGIIRAKKGQGL